MNFNYTFYLISVARIVSFHYVMNTESLIGSFILYFFPHTKSLKPLVCFTLAAQLGLTKCDSWLLCWTAQL